MVIPVPTPYPIAFSIDFVTNVTSTLGLARDHVSFYPYESAVSNTANIIEKKLTNDHHWNDQQRHSRNDDPNFGIGGKLFYDWNLRSQRIDHDSGSYECVHFYQTNLPCSLYFLPHGGMYRIIHHHHDNDYNHDNDEYEYDDDDRMERMDPTTVDCCLDLSNIHTIPPDWASHIVNSTYNGIVWDEYSQLWALQWSFDHIETISADKPIETSHHLESSLTPRDMNQRQNVSLEEERLQSKPRRTRRRRYLRDKQSKPRASASSDSVDATVYDYHTVREVAFGPNSGKPLTFTFPGGAMGRQDYHYDINTLFVGSQDPSLFELPPECLQRACQ